MEDLKDKPIYSREVIEFVTVAREFCAFLEKLDEHKMKGRDFLNVFQKLLPLLYYKGSVLPAVEPEFDEGNEKFVSEEEWLAIRMKVLHILGEADDYLDVYNERMEEQDRPPGGSLSENIADIYQDLKDFLMLYSAGVDELMNDALWECRQNFERYWGLKAINAATAIHDALFSGKALSFEHPQKPEERDTSEWIMTKRQKDLRGENE